MWRDEMASDWLQRIYQTTGGVWTFVNLLDATVNSYQGTYTVRQDSFPGRAKSGFVST